VPALDNPKWEAYAQACARGANQTSAYADVYGKNHTSSASRLAANANVRARISELQDEQRQVHADSVAQAVQNRAISIETILEALERALAGAEKDQDWRTVVAAAMAQARVTGNIAPEKHLVKNVGPSVSDLSDEELEARLDALSGSVRAQQLEQCARLRLNPDEITLAQFWEAQDEDRGIDRSDQALDVTPEDEPLGTRHMPLLGSRGVRVVGYERPKPPLTKGEAEKLHRRGVNAPRIINGSVTPNERR
jgi:hypothetical protein